MRANLAIVCGHPRWNPTLRWSSYADYARGAIAQAEKLGYTMSVFWRYEPGMSARRLRQILESRGVSGVLLLMIKDLNELDLKWDRLALATSAEIHHRPRMHCTVRHLYDDTCTAIGKCLSLGYRRIGLCMEDRYDEYHFDGVVQGAFYMKTRGFSPADRLPPFTLPFSDAKSRGPFVRWLRKHRPEVIISIGSWVYRWLIDSGYRVPEDVGYVDLTTDNDNEDFTRMDPRRALLGAGGTNLLVGQIQRNERGWPEEVRYTTVSSEWREGKTTRKLERRAPVSRRGRGGKA